MNTEWKQLTPDTFPQNEEDTYISWENDGTVIRMSNDAYIIAMDRDHMPKKCQNAGNETMLDYEGRYIIRIFYAQHTVDTNTFTGAVTYDEKAFYSTDGMVIPIDDKDMKYCMYKKVRMTDLPA